MLIAISGSQGSGKSTVLSELEKYGYPIVKRKTSRSVLKDWNVSLEEVNNDPNLSCNFQTELTDRKYKDEFNALHSDDLEFTERTHADLFTYALINLGKLNEHSDWLNEYYSDCMMYQAEYSLVFYLAGGQFQIESDGVRGSNQHYGRMVDLTMFEFTKQMTHPSKMNVIDVLNINDRTNIILTQTKQLFRTQ